MIVTSIEEILEGATETEKHVAAGGTVGVENPFLHPATEDQVTAVAAALEQPKLAVDVVAHGAAALAQLRAQTLEAEIKLIEHSIEGLTAILNDKMRAHAVEMASVRAYHEGK